MLIYSAQVHPGHALGFMVLGASIHDILTRLKLEPQRFSKIDLVFEQSSPLIEPVILDLPDNGLRLRFDGPEQRLRLIEVLDFTKCYLTYKDKDIVRLGVLNPSNTNQSEGQSGQSGQSGPSFRHIYNRLLGPTFPGEYIESELEDETEMGTYVLSYPGIAFSFPLAKNSWSPQKDCFSLLSSSATQFASSMAIFRGKSWSDVRNSLFTGELDMRELHSISSKNRELVRDDVKLVRIHGEGQVELLRLEGMPPFWINLGHTSPQDLIVNLGPPDAIYRKNDQKLSIHKSPVAGIGRLKKNNVRIHDDSTDTDQSSAYTVTDDSDTEESSDDVVGSVSGEYFYNYFYHGFDILLSNPVNPSPCPPSKVPLGQKKNRGNIIPADSQNRLVTTKIILHGNSPGSYAFNRHRRCRWEIQYLNSKEGQNIVNSESSFLEIGKRLQEEWKSSYRNTEEEKAYQRGMVLNRDWGDSLGSSCELLGGWEENINYKRTDCVDDIKGLGNTTLYGFPGLVFEVMKNGFISSLTVF